MGSALECSQDMIVGSVWCFGVANKLGVSLKALAAKLKSSCLFMTCEPDTLESEFLFLNTRNTTKP